MDTNFTSPANKKIESSQPAGFWNWLTKAPSISSEQARNARLIAYISTGLAVVWILTGVWAVLTTKVSFNSAVLLLAGAALVVVHILNRLGYYDAAVVTLIGVLAVAPAVVVAGLENDKNLAFLELAAVVSSTSIMLTGAFYSKQAWGLAATLLVAALYLLLPIAHPVYAFTDVVYAAVTLAVVGLTTLVVQNHWTAQSREKVAKSEAIIATLRDTEAELRKAKLNLERVAKDHDIELQAVSDEYERAVLETEQAKQQSDRANHVKSAFLASMSHELRTPLNAIINFTKFVVNGDLGEVNPEQVETLTEVVNSGRHLLNLINDVLDMSKIESGSLNLFIEDNVDVNSIVNSVMTTGKSLLADKPVKLSVTMDEKLPLIRADRQRIVQVLLNLMSNACKFTSEGSIAVRVRQDNADIVFSVEDTGPGIAPEDQALVFEAFKQTDAGLRQGGGTGLGMPISKNLVEAHGGRLWLDSERGKGSTFFVSLPVKAEHLVTTFSPGGLTK